MGKIVFLAVVVLALALALPAHAGVLPLDEKNIHDGKVIQDGIVYRILSDENVFLLFTGGFSEYRRVVVEDMNRTDAIKARNDGLVREVNNITQEIAQLDNKSLELETGIRSTKEIVTKLQSDRDADFAEIVRLREQSTMSITGMLTVSPLAFRVGLALFILLFIIVIGMKANFMLSASRSRRAAEATKPAGPTLPNPPLKTGAPPAPVKDAASASPVVPAAVEKARSVEPASESSKPSSVNSKSPYSQLGDDGK